MPNTSNPSTSDKQLLIAHESIQHLANAHRNAHRDSHRIKPRANDSHPLLERDCEIAAESIKQWPGYDQTPLLDLTGLASASNVDKLWCKDEAPRFGLGSFKALGGAYAVSVLLRSALAEKLGREVSVSELADGAHRELTADMVVCCATDGNHGRSVAWGAQRFGCRCIIYIHSEVSEGRKSAIEHYAAEVIRIDGNYDDSVRLAASEAEKNGWTVVSDTSYPGYLDIPADVMRGYTLLADEAYDQISESGSKLPTHVLLQGGVGGFAAAIAERVRARSSDADFGVRIIVVEPDKAACIHASIEAGEPVAIHGDLDTLMAGLACGEVSVIAFQSLLSEVDDVLVITDEAAVDCMRLLADGVNGDEALVSGESGVTGLAGMLIARRQAALSDALELNSESRVLVISTEGATDPDVYEQLVGRSAEQVMAV